LYCHSRGAVCSLQPFFVQGWQSVVQPHLTCDAHRLVPVPPLSTARWPNRSPGYNSRRESFMSMGRWRFFRSPCDHPLALWSFWNSRPALPFPAAIRSCLVLAQGPAHPHARNERDYLDACAEGAYCGTSRLKSPAMGIVEEGRPSPSSPC